MLLVAGQAVAAPSALIGGVPSCVALCSRWCMVTWMTPRARSWSAVSATSSCDQVRGGMRLADGSLQPTLYCLSCCDTDCMPSSAHGGRHP